MFRKTVLLAVLPALTLFAEETNQVPVVVVTAQALTRNLLDTPAAESAALEIATSTVDSEQITQQNATTLTDALAYTPGAHTETRGRKYKSLTSFRGQIYPYPTYSLDGVWQREFAELAYVLPASQIGQIDVQRSSGSLLSGLGDITGVINVQPRRYDEQTTAIEAEVGTFGSYRTGLSQGRTTSNGWYTAGANNMNTDGPSGRNAAENVTSVYAFGGAKVNESLTLEGQFFVVDGYREFMSPDPDGPALDKLKSVEEDYDFSAFHIGGKAYWKQSATATLELSAGYTERNYLYTKETISSGAESTFDEDDYEYNLQAIQALELTDANTLRFGTSYNHWVAPDGKRSYTGYRQDVETVGLVLADEHRFDKLTLDAGLKLQRDYYNEYSGASFTINGANRDFKTVTDEWGDPLLTATLGAKYELTQTWSLYSHLAGGQRAAEPGALKLDGTDLDTEERIMLDAGVQFADSKIGSFKIGGFYVLRKDAVVKTSDSATDANGDTYYFSDNQDLTQIGLELDAQTAPLTDVATLFFNLLLMDSRLTPADSDDTQDYIEIPDLIASAGVTFNAGRWDSMLAAKYVAGYENNRFVQSGEYVDLGDYVDVNASIGYTLGKRYNTRIYLAASNLLDDEYSTVAGWSDPGATFSFGARHEF
jgi:outer membrane cobalamin receptor